MKDKKNKPRTISPRREVRGEKVIVAMSGGIDSSVAAALLKRSKVYPEFGRRDVSGVFMKLDELKSSKENEKRARAVAKKLGIPFHILNLKKEFKEKVIKPFIKGYKKGITPNPCVVCNKEIKFKFLFKELKKLEADFFAAGHYARIKKGKLLKGKDKNKDQSYFLWQLTPKLLNKALFPVGGYTKKEVKQLAKYFELPTKDISDSQEICFIQTTIHPVKSRGAGISPKAKLFNGVNDFLKKYLKTEPGKIIDDKGKTIGEHQGLWFYTIGQRKGIKLSGGPAFARLRRTKAGKPFYILNKDIKKNLLIVTQSEKDLYKKELIAKNINWISGKEPELPLKITVKIRYRHRPAKAIIYKIQNTKYKIQFDRPQRAITPGQSAVFYRGQEVLGGGIII